jgi:signal peptidase II
LTKKRKRPEPPPPDPRSRRAVIICTVATLALLGMDLGTKEWAEGALSTERFGDPPPVCEPDEYGRVATQRVRTDEVVVVEGYLMFRYAENCGAAFGLLRDAPPIARKAVFGLAAAAASIVLFMMFVKGRGQALFAWSVPMIVSGALGNLVDRVRYGYVVDFIRFHLQDGWEWPTFNIADCGITVGVILLVLDGFRESREEKAREAAAGKKKDEGSSEKAKAGESAPSGAAEP